VIVTARSKHVGYGCNDCDSLWTGSDHMLRSLLLSITACTEGGTTRYKGGEENVALLSAVIKKDPLLKL